MTTMMMLFWDVHTAADDDDGGGGDDDDDDDDDNDHDDNYDDDDAFWDLHTCSTRPPVNGAEQSAGWMTAMPSSPPIRPTVLRSGRRVAAKTLTDDC